MVTKKMKKIQPKGGKSCKSPAKTNHPKSTDTLCLHYMLRKTVEKTNKKPTNYIDNQSYPRIMGSKKG